MPNLPEPFNPTEQYLKAILDKLEEIHPSTEWGESNEVQLREPVASVKVGNPRYSISDDFPGAKLLKSSGKQYYDEIPVDLDALMNIPGIGLAKAKSILDALIKV